jgi:ATP-dependent helicase/nuclease subunit B
MESVDTSKRELATTEFGTLAHHAFQQLFMDSSMKQSVKVAEIEEFLIEAARTEMHRLYGRRPAPLISIQFETLTQNLRYAAETEAAQRKDGWHILLAEEVFGDEKDATPLLIEGARLRCKIDRVDRHERSGHIRVLDYKTSDKARSPLEAHVTKIGPRKKLAEEDQWKTFQHSHGETYLWTDLQLPLYAAALRLRGLEPQSVGYFALPKSVQETSVLLWDDFGDDWIDGGLQCAAEIVRRLRDGQFWPPARKAWEHGYDELFLGDIAASFEFR